MSRGLNISGRAATVSGRGVQAGAVSTGPTTISFDDTSNFTTLNGGSQVSSPVVASSYSVECGDGDEHDHITVDLSPYSATKITYYTRESSNAGGYQSKIYDSSGNELISVGSGNPTIRVNENQTNSGAYDTWFKIELTPDYANDQYDVAITNQSDSTTETLTASPKDVSTIASGDHTKWALGSDPNSSAIGPPNNSVWGDELSIQE